MRSVLFQTACAFCAAFSFLAINSFESTPKSIEAPQSLSCHKCHRPNCSGCGGGIVTACDCEDCRKKRINNIPDEIQQVIAGCRCGDGGAQMMACKHCGGKKKKKKNIPSPHVFTLVSI